VDFEETSLGWELGRIDRRAGGGKTLGPGSLRREEETEGGSYHANVRSDDRGQSHVSRSSKGLIKSGSAYLGSGQWASSSQGKKDSA